MKLSSKNKVMVSKILMYGAILAVIFAMVGWLGRDIWLASTQWLLVAALLTLFGIYLNQN
jgi:hypothetical protein